MPTRTMHGTGIWLQVALTLFLTGPAVSLVLSLPSRSAISLSTSRTAGTYRALCTSRPHRRRLSSLQAVEGQEGHLLPEDDGAAAGNDWRERTIRSRWSKGQGSWSGSSRKTKADGTATNGLVESGGVEMAQTIEVGTRPMEGSVRSNQGNIAVDMGPGAGLENGSAAEVESKPNVTKKRLKKYFIKDFEDSSWTVGIQWRNQPYRVQTTKVALKSDGSVVWLDKGKGSWRLRTRSRDLVFYRDFFLNWKGKRIFCAKLLTNTCDMYIEGQIKGWAPFTSLEVMGTFQAVRRGIVVDENTPRPPWESRPAPEMPVIDGRQFPSNKEVLADVDLS